jgi:hypothetical protein
MSVIKQQEDEVVCKDLNFRGDTRVLVYVLVAKQYNQRKTML